MSRGWSEEDFDAREASQESLEQNSKISRPRQIYNGPTERPYVLLSDR